MSARLSLPWYAFRRCCTKETVQRSGFYITGVCHVHFGLRFSTPRLFQSRTEYVYSAVQNTV